MASVLILSFWRENGIGIQDIFPVTSAITQYLRIREDDACWLNPTARIADPGQYKWPIPAKTDAFLSIVLAVVTSYYWDRRHRAQLAGDYTALVKLV